MEYWEFLLQKEGDRSWLALKVSSTQVLEGRYRVVANSSRPNAEVEICITHQILDEDPPKRRTQKRSRHTNPEGLMVVIPFVYLKPGIWEFRCTGDVMSEMMGESWQEVVELQVLPKISMPVATAPVFPLNTSTALPTVEVVNRSFEETVAPVASVPETTPVPEVLEPVANLPETILEPIAKIAETTSAPEVLPPVVEDAPPIPPRLQLPILPIDTASLGNLRDRSAQIADLILEQALEPGLLPETANVETPAIEVEVEVEEDLPELILTLERDTLAASREGAIALTGKISPFAENPNLIFTGLLNYQLRDPQNSTLVLEGNQPLSNQVPPFNFNLEIQLPPEPQLHLLLGEIAICSPRGTIIATQSFNVTADLRELLGTFLQRAEESAALADARQSRPKANPLNLDLLNLVDKPAEPVNFTTKESGQQILPPQIYPSGKTAQTPALPNFSNTLSEDDATVLPPEDPETVAQEVTPRDELFESLKLQERFWARLNSLSVDAEDVEPSETIENEPYVLEATELVVAQPDVFEQEIVVDDDEYLPPLPVEEPPSEAKIPVPTPELKVPPGELISGQTINIWVKLPTTPTPHYVKFWLQDRQSRTLLDGPHWLVDFFADGFGDMEAMVQLTVPFGSMEIRLEAIAIDIHTQQESHKIGVERIVIPPNLPEVRFNV